MSGSNDDDAPPIHSQDPGWVGYELHDGLLQWVMGAKLQLQSLLDADGRVSRGGDTLQSAVQNSLRYLDNAAREGRQLIDFLESSSRAGTPEIERGLLQLCENSPHNDEAQIQVDYQSHVEFVPQVPPTVVWNVLRIVQQAIGNAVQHAAPSRIVVTLDMETSGRASERDAVWLRVTVEDDGRGFDVDRQTQDAGSQHFGLASMHHRARLIGGSLQINSTAQGTRVEVAFPATNWAVD